MMIARVGLILMVTAASPSRRCWPTNGIRSWRQALPALGGWLLVTIAHALFWAAAAIRVNVSGRSSTYNAVALLGIWLGLTVIVPALGTMALVGITPAPSRLLLMQPQRRLEKRGGAAGARGDGGVPS